MRPSSLNWQQDDGVLKLQGHLTARQVPVLARAIPVPSEVIVDLGEVQRVDSAGVALLFDWLQNNAALKLVHAPNQLKQLVDIFGLNAPFQLDE